jgi:hypothetical protein
MSLTFESVEIDGSFIKEFTLVTSEDVRMILLRAPQDDSAEQVTMRSALTFHNVSICHASFRAQPWLEITSHDTLARAEYDGQRAIQEKRSVERGSGPPSENFQMFRIVCDEGEIAILAESFAFEPIEKIPHFKWSSIT